MVTQRRTSLCVPCGQQTCQRRTVTSPPPPLVAFAPAPRRVAHRAVAVRLVPAPGVIGRGGPRPPAAVVFSNTARLTTYDEYGCRGSGTASPHFSPGEWNR